MNRPVRCEDFKGLKLFKYVEKIEYAYDLCKGDVYFGTLSKYRSIEQAQRGDKHEGTYQEVVNLEFGDSDSEEKKRMLHRLGYNFHATSGVVMNDIVNTISHDAYIFCTALKPLGEEQRSVFGKYCIEIQDAFEFYKCIDESFNDFYKGLPYESGCGPIEYEDRESEANQTVLKELAFIKPISFREQFEFRYLLRPRIKVKDKIGYIEGDLLPLTLHCKGLEGICKLVE
ncbi:Uncharacterised protein [Klebsiella pneumoniae]|uniref:hypothetical protein n=1 Tax=Klebsiella pneumoniae TaxID=573 RepID=UPI000E2BADF9|nr:hypothetical protein [Klebsiella pneumoniae]MCE0033380.1 hypothetical protein [Klebsiella pneumoniae]SXT63900.1 Uncharacterised protein [Klebsiella pneumoniae]